MQWNWQQADWPHFQYDQTNLDRLEAQFLRESGILLGTFTHLADDEQRELTVDLISTEALKTSEIEGEYLSRESVQSSIRRHFGLQTDNRQVAPAERGIADLMINLYQTWQAPLTHSQLHQWHGMLMQGRRDLVDIGGYRTDNQPMQVISGNIRGLQVHFEAPPSEQIPSEMNKFVNWFAQSNASDTQLPILTRAGIAHLYFVTIHPYEDGNGRIARAIAEKVISQGLQQPALISLSYTIEQDRKAYYKALANANRNNEITAWLHYFAQTILDAQLHTQTQLDFLIQKTKLYDRLRGQLNERQEKVLARLFRQGPQGFTGGLSAKNYVAITKTSRPTATRDLQDMVRKGALTQTGQLRYTRYHLNI